VVLLDSRAARDLAQRTAAYSVPPDMDDARPVLAAVVCRVPRPVQLEARHRGHGGDTLKRHLWVDCVGGLFIGIMGSLAFIVMCSVASTLAAAVVSALTTVLGGIAWAFRHLGCGVV
jgi:hypothetical protein